jgi:hypothetical protein
MAVLFGTATIRNRTKLFTTKGSLPKKNSYNVAIATIASTLPSSSDEVSVIIDFIDSERSDAIIV